MQLKHVEAAIRTLEQNDHARMFGRDFLLTWDHTESELRAVLALSEALKRLREVGISPPRV